MRRFTVPLLVAILFLCVCVGFAPGWWVKGHESITEAAASKLPDDVPAFFRAGGKHLAHFAGDPDRWKNRECKVLRASVEADDVAALLDVLSGDRRLEAREAAKPLRHALRILEERFTRRQERVSLARGRFQPLRFPLHLLQLPLHRARFLHPEDRAGRKVIEPAASSLVGANS